MVCNVFKRYAAIASVAMVVLVMSGCKETDLLSSQFESSDTSSRSVVKQESSSESEPKSEVEELEKSETVLDEMGLPKMTEENQMYYNTYLRDFNTASPFLFSFSEGNFEFFNVCRVYSALTKPKEYSEVPIDEVGKKISEFFPISTEQAHSLSKSRDLSADKQSYLIFDYQEEFLTVGVIVASEKKENILTLTCDWYTTSHPDSPAGTYVKCSTSITTINVDANGKYFYLSNESTKV